MSRAYQIRVSDSVTKTVHVEDGLTFRLELLDVVSKERTRSLLTEELATRGFEPEDGRWVRRTGEIEVSVEPTTGDVAIRLDASATITREGSKRGVTQSPDAGKAALSRALAAELEQSIADDADVVRAKVTAELERHIPALRQELDRVTNRVVANALKERARQLGEIEELSEDEATGDLTIRVRV